MDEEYLLMNDCSFSIIILNWNGGKNVIETVSKLAKQTYTNYEVIVVDQDSTDGSREELERKFPQIKLVRLSKNVGVPAGRNKGILHSKGAILFFLDNDAILEKTVLQKVAHRFYGDRNLGIIGCKVLDYNIKKLYLRWVYPKFQISESDTEFETFIFPGGACAIRRSVIDKVGLYDEELFFAREEEGIGLRCINTGYKIIYYPAALVFHKVLSQKRKFWKSKGFFFSVRNRLWNIWRYFPAYSAFSRSLVLIIGLFMKSSRNLVLFTYFKALLTALRELPFILKTRSPISAKAYKKYISLNDAKRGPIFYQIKNELFGKM